MWELISREDTPDVSYVRKDIRPSPSLVPRPHPAHTRRRGLGVGVRLALSCFSVLIALESLAGPGNKAREKVAASTYFFEC